MVEDPNAKKNYNSGAFASSGAVATIRGGKQTATQLIVVHQALVDEVGHASGWGSGAQLDAMSTLDARVATLVEAIEEIDPHWDESLLFITAINDGMIV